MEFALGAPLLMLLVALLVQLGLWAVGDYAARAAANHALQTTRVVGGTEAAGRDDATTLLAQYGGDFIVDPTVTVTRTATVTTVTIPTAVHLGRAAIDVNAAAAAAARAASLSRSAPAATSAARTAATANLAGQCAAVSVTVDTSAFHRGGAVTVTVACTVTTHGLTGISIPGSVTTQASSTSPIDVYRSISLGFANSQALSGARATTRGGDPT